MNTLGILGIVCVCLGLLIDIFSLILGVRKLRNKSGPSGLPGYPFAFYLLGTYLIFHKLIGPLFQILIMIGFLAIHLLFQGLWIKIANALFKK